jgi:hypothetical protein
MSSDLGKLRNQNTVQCHARRSHSKPGQYNWRYVGREWSANWIFLRPARGSFHLHSPKKVSKVVVEEINFARGSFQICLIYLLLFSYKQIHNLKSMALV